MKQPPVTREEHDDHEARLQSLEADRAAYRTSINKMNQLNAATMAHLSAVQKEQHQIKNMVARVLKHIEKPERAKKKVG